MSAQDAILADYQKVQRTEVHDATDQAEKERLFGQLTDAAGELMNLGFEDIYQDSKAKIADTLGE